MIKVALRLIHDTKLFGPTAHSFQHGIHFERGGFFDHYLLVVASFGMVQHQQSFGFRSIASEFVERKSVSMAEV
jgi:hypothetical protein